jgi:hypothetical protein
LSKPEFEFFPATNVPWTPVAGGPAGLTERILAHDPKAGVATRMLHMDPGTDTSQNGTITHLFWEEVYILQGQMYDLALKQNFTAGMYACRPPGMKHGPWTSDEGCTTFEVRYFAKGQ